jgi:hypothetical protein
MNGLPDSQVFATQQSFKERFVLARSIPFRVPDKNGVSGSICGCGRVAVLRLQRANRGTLDWWLSDATAKWASCQNQNHAPLNSRDSCLTNPECSVQISHQLYGASESLTPTLEENQSSLTREIERYRQIVDARAVRYKTLHISTRLALITLSAIVASQASLSSMPTFRWLTALAPALALTVAILTSVDTWMKPGQIGKVCKSHKFCFAQHNSTSQATLSDPDELKQLKEKFRRLQQDYASDSAY